MHHVKKLQEALGYKHRLYFVETVIMTNLDMEEVSSAPDLRPRPPPRGRGGRGDAAQQAALRDGAGDAGRRDAAAVRDELPPPLPGRAHAAGGARRDGGRPRGAVP